VTITIAMDAPVETEGASSALETLEPGVSVEMEVDEDGRVAKRIAARQAKVHGAIVQIEGDEITVESERGNRIVAIITDINRIELEDDIPSYVADLHVGLEMEIKFDPESMAASKIDV
jgi:hypothetical protein